MNADAVIVSAGRGQRFTEGEKKQFRPLANRPILAHTLEKFQACPLIRHVLLVVAKEDMEYAMKEIVEKYKCRKVFQLVPGGKRRQDSAKNGIESLPKDSEIVVIHDGVRPLVTKEIIEESIHLAARFGAVVTATPVKDTIKVSDSDGTIQRTLEREALWQAQTPQTFRVDLIREAYQKAARDGFVGNDDASLVERLGVKVHLLSGSYENIKITTLEDLLLAELFLKAKTREEKGTRTRSEKK